MKNIFANALLTAMFVLSIALIATAQNKLNVVVDGQSISFKDVAPYIDETGNVHLPVGLLAENLGAECSWNGVAHTAEIKKSGTTVTIVQGENYIYADSEKIMMNSPAIIRNDRLYISAIYAAAAFNYELLWDENNNTLTLSSKPTLDSETLIPEASSNEEYEVTADAMDFNLSLFNQMPNDKNFMFSPFSVKIAFLMAANGAEGETKEEILKALAISDMDEYNLESKKIIEDINKNGDIIFNVSNSIWYNKEYNRNAKFSEKYKTDVLNYFGANAGEVTLTNAVKTINDYISDKTNERIKDVIDDPKFLAALVNTIYFKADWWRQFEKEATREDYFTDRNGKKSKIDFMNQTAGFNYFEDDDFQMLEMGYKGADVSMYVFLPKGEAELTANIISNALENKTGETVFVKLPKFKTEFGDDLVDAMKALGIKKAFDRDCRDFQNVMFEGIDPSHSVYISDVIHKSFIEVDEKGTEAAAATVILFAESAAVERIEPKIFEANHPFTYLIRDNENGEVFFMGQYSFAE